MAGMVIIAILTAYFSYYISINIYKRIINPITIFLTINLVSIIFMYGVGMIDSNLSGKTIWLIFSSFMFYIIGLLIGEKIRVTLKSVGRQKNYKRVTSFIRLKYCIIFYAIVFDLSTFIYLFDLQKSLGITYIIGNLSHFNSLIQEGFFSGKIYYYFLPIGITLSLLIIFYINSYKTKYKKLLILQLIICFIPFISARRGWLFNMAVMDFILFYFLNGGNLIKTSHKKVIKKFMLFLVMLIGSISFLSFSQKLLNKSFDMKLKFFGIPLPNFLNDPVLYVAGNYAYLNESINTDAVHFISPLISTIRFIYIYIINRVLSINIDTTTPFALKFYNFDVQGNAVSFNTAPIQYYIMIESGIFYSLFFIILGYISAKAFKSMKLKNNLGNMLLSTVLFSILFWSFRGYDLIYLNTLIIIISMLLVKFFTDVKKNTQEGGNKWRKF